MAPASAPFWTFDQEIFEKELTLATVQRAAAGEAPYFAIFRGFDANDLIFCGTVRTLKQCEIGHWSKIVTGAIYEKGRF
jgi:hypothetical protein